MELRQLEYFVAVAEEANFTRAAQRVHVSQSGVSAQIRQLERDLGAALIDRSGRVASLTGAGAGPVAFAADGAALQRQGVESKLLVYPDEGHWVLKPQNSELWYNTVLGWFDAHLKPKSQP